MKNKIPDISRTCSTQEKRRSLIDGVKIGETYEVIEVRRNGLQVDPPGVVSVLLHQVSEQELTHRALLKEGSSELKSRYNRDYIKNYTTWLFYVQRFRFNVFIIVCTIRSEKSKCEKTHIAVEKDSYSSY